MTSFDRFERSLPALLDELAAPRTPDYFDDILARTAATRQRPGWTFPERWLPMSALSQRLAGAPRIPWRLAGAVALLLLALVIGLLIAGSRQSHLPAPFGPAANGQVAYVQDDGAIAIGNVDTGASQVVVPGPFHTRPIFSPDGTRIAFIHARRGGGFDLQVVRADGTDLRTLNAKGMPRPAFLQWAPSGTSLAVTYAGILELFDTTKTGEPTVLTAIPSADIGSNGFNDHVASLFRPPHGDELLFVNPGPPEVTLQAIRPDGSGLRTIVDGTSSGLEYVGLSGAQWSPDGSQVVVLVSFAVNPDWSHLYLVNADGTNFRPLNGDSTDPMFGAGNPAWSPDGKRIAFQHWTSDPSAPAGETFNPIGIVDVATGAMVDVGATMPNGFFSWAWSPDGKSILEVPQDESGELLVVDIVTGRPRLVNWPVGEAVSWQRLAP